MAKPAPLAYELNRFIYDAIVALERQIVAQQPQSKLPFVIRKVSARVGLSTRFCRQTK